MKAEIGVFFPMILLRPIEPPVGGSAANAQGVMAAFQGVACIVLGKAFFCLPALLSARGSSLLLLTLSTHPPLLLCQAVRLPPWTLRIRRWCCGASRRSARTASCWWTSL